MDRVRDIEDQIFSMAQIPPTASFRAFLRSRINSRYRELWDRYVWRDAVVMHESWSYTADTAEQILPKEVGRLLCITDTTNENVLEPVNRRLFQTLTIGESTSTGTPLKFTDAGSSGTLAQPTSASVVSCVSSDADDTETVTIRGLVSAQLDYETVTLTGTTSVDTTKSFSRVDRISKSGATEGRVTVTSNSGAVTLAVIAPDEVTPEHTKIRMYYIPSSESLYITYMKRFRKLVADNDVPLMDCCDILFQGGLCDALRQEKNWSAYNVAYSEFQKMMTNLELADHKKDEIMRAVPMVSKGSLHRNQYG